MLDATTLRKFVTASESRTLEKKTNCPNGSELRKSLVALANSTYEDEYSVILLGVTDDGKVAGLQGLDSLQKTVLSASKDCFPPIPIEMQVFETEGKELLAVVIRNATEKPYFTGKSYTRTGSVSQETSRQAFEELISQRTDKARRILSEKDHTVSVLFPDGNRVIRPEPGSVIPAPNLRTYKVQGCDSWILRFQDIDSGRRFACALEDVKIEWDSERDRLQLVVKINSQPSGISYVRIRGL